MRTIAHISDVHFGTTQPRIVDALVRELNERKPSLIVLSGDLTQRARASQYRQAAEFIARLESPKLIVPGNHDVPLYDFIMRFAAPLANYTKHITKDLRPVCQDDEMIVAGINTSRSFSLTLNGFWKDGKISEEQLLDLELRFKDAGPNKLKVVVTHHPFIPPPGERPHGIVHGATRALAVLERVGVDIVLAGHLHMGYSGDVRAHHEATKRSILAIQAGTATSDRLRGGEPNAYNWLELELHHAKIEVRAWNGATYKTSTVKNFIRENGTWEEKKSHI
ncbi:MAG: metallophosphoesterase [Anaerolineae bacterium]|nr:metallophosphoesterase [Phycisphaerae bacterium]